MKVVRTGAYPLMLATWYICSRMMRETYEPKVYYCWVHMQKSNQQGSSKGRVWESRDKWAVQVETSVRKNNILIIESYINNLNGTDGCRVLCHQFYTSSLHRLRNSISRCNMSFWELPSGNSASATRPKETKVWYLCFGMAQCTEPYPWEQGHVLERITQLVITGPVRTAYWRKTAWSGFGEEDSIDPPYSMAVPFALHLFLLSSD